MTSEWSARAVSPDEAVAAIRSGMRVFVHGAAATPTTLLEALARRTDLEGVTVYHLHTAGPAPFAEPDKAGQFRSVSLFTGAPLRGPIDRGARRLRAGLPVGHPGPVPSGACRSTWPWCRCRRRTTTASARSARRSTPPRRRRHGAAGHRRDQRADAAHARQHRRAARRVDAFVAHRPPAARARARRRETAVEAAIGEHIADAGRGRLHAADGHRRHPRRGAARGSATSATSACTPRCSPTA